jgi:hypothetical protein
LDAIYSEPPGVVGDGPACVDRVVRLAAAVFGG